MLCVQFKKKLELSSKSTSIDYIFKSNSSKPTLYDLIFYQLADIYPHVWGIILIVLLVYVDYYFRVLKS